MAARRSTLRMILSLVVDEAEKRQNHHEEHEEHEEKTNEHYCIALYRITSKHSKKPVFPPKP
jgi:hypothetical protein